MKADNIRMQITVSGETKILAIVIAILAPLGFGTQERILKTVLAHFGFRLERA